MWRAAAVAGVLVLFGAPLAAGATAGPDDVVGVGVFTPYTPSSAGDAAARWQLRTTPDAGDPELDVHFGLGEQPVVGDFDGDGHTDLAVFVPAMKVQPAVWQIRTSAGSGPAELAFAYGGAGSIGVAGDWDGDGTAGIGTFAPATASVPPRWQLRNIASSGGDDAIVYFGDADGVPVTGDWDGDGRTDIGTVTPATDDAAAHWHLRTGLSSVGVDIQFDFGGPGTVPVTGDFNGDGRTDIGVYTPASRIGQGRWQLRFSVDGGPIQREFRYGGPGTVPITGSWNVPAVTPQPTASPEPTATPVETATLADTQAPPPPPSQAPVTGTRTLPAFSPLNARVTYFWTARGTRLTIGQLIARDLPAATTVTISCAGKHCPFKQLTVKPKGSSRNLLTTLGKRKVFRAGQTVDVRMTAPGHYTKLLRFKLARGKVPIGRAYCVLAGEKKLRAKC